MTAFSEELEARVEQRKCKGVDPNLFLPERGDWRAVATARAVCRDCVVVQECFDYAMRHRLDVGVFGGTTAQRRRILLKRWLAGDIIDAREEAQRDLVRPGRPRQSVPA